MSTQPIVPTAPISEFPNAINVARLTGIPHIALGAPGIGKTQLTHQYVKAHNLQLAEVIFGGRDPGSFFMPYVQPGNGLTFHYNPTLPVLGNPAYSLDSPILLFADEITTASRLNQTFLLKLFDEHKIGEADLMPNVFIVAAGNRLWDMAQVEQLTSALCNRGNVVYYDVDVDYWKAHAFRLGLNAITIGWIHFDPSNLQNFDPKAFQAGDFAHCSPRSIEQVARLTDAYQAGHMSDSLFRALVCGSLGMSRGTKYVTYAKIQAKLPDLDRILEGKPTPVPDEPAVVYVSIAALVNRATPKNLHHICAWVGNLSSEWHMVFTKTINDAKVALVATAAWSKWLVEHANSLS
jgi:hypothetical protein